jgi:hypothetical protein
LISTSTSPPRGPPDQDLDDLERLLGFEGDGGAGFHVSASCAAYARVCVEEAIAYAQQRETFGKPLTQHQVIRHKLVDMMQKVVGDGIHAADVGLAAHPGRKSGRRNLHAEEPGDADHGPLRLRSRADLSAAPASCVAPRSSASTAR